MLLAALHKLRIWQWKRRYRPGTVVSRFLAPDVRRDVEVLDTSRIDAGVITARTRTWNVLYAIRKIEPEHAFGNAKELAVKELWNWTGEPWGGPVPDSNRAAKPANAPDRAGGIVSVDRARLGAGPAGDRPCVMQQEKRHYEFLEPWWSTDEQDGHFHETFLNQLKTEVGPDHVMYGLPVRMIGRDGASDDTLFEILDGTGRLALVHLTWAKGQERLPWPGTAIYPSFEAFKTERLIPQNQDYLEE